MEISQQDSSWFQNPRWVCVFCRGTEALKQALAAFAEIWRLAKNALRFYGVVWSKSKPARMLQVILAHHRFWLDGEPGEWSTSAEKRAQLAHYQLVKI
jgi:hypothetical protein